MDLRTEYLSRHQGDTTAAACELARDLMRGDPRSFQAGYTLPNAAIAAAELFSHDPGPLRREIETRLGREIEPDGSAAEPLGRCQ